MKPAISPSARTEAHNAMYGSAFTELTRNCFALRFLEGHHLECSHSRWVSCFPNDRVGSGLDWLLSAVP